MGRESGGESEGSPRDSHPSPALQGEPGGQRKRRDKTGLELGMKESYAEGLANHCGLEPYADDGNVNGVASARGTGRPAIELRNQTFRVPTLCCPQEGNTLDCVSGK
jgi:hypothetical protein